MKAISRLFTDEEKQRFFECAGFRVFSYSFFYWERETHGSWGKVYNDEPAVKLGQTVRKVSTLFDEVMREKLKNLLTGSSVDDNALIRAIVEKGGNDER